MHSILLVAQREFVENARTKSFWIGILIFPVILGLFFVVPTLLERTKGARRYAVIDRSGWLLEAVDHEILTDDLATALRAAAERAAREGDSAVVPVLRPLLSLLGDSSPGAVRSVARALAVSPGEAGEAERSAGLGPAARATLEAHAAAIRAWWVALPEAHVEEVAPGASRERYVRPASAADAEGDLDRLRHQVADGELFALFVIGPDPVTGNQGSRYISKNLTDTDLRDWFAELASEQVRARRLAQEAIDPAVARWIQSPVRFEARKVSGEGAEEAVDARDRLRQWAPVVFVYLLWVSVFTVAQMLLTNTVEEKSNRIIEVLLSSVSPVELMAGKIAGIAVTGLTIVGSWMLVFFLGAKFVPRLMATSGLPDLSVLAGDPVLIGSFLIYFLLGYLLFAALLVGIGAVCTTLKEAQNLMGPVTLMLLVPLLSMIPIGRDPNGVLAKVMSYIPPFTPFVMMNRAAGPPTLGEYALTALLLVVSIGVALWAAAKVFRIGVLLTGKPPKLKEIVRWVRAPVGSVPHRRMVDN